MAITTIATGAALLSVKDLALASIKGGQETLYITEMDFAKEIFRDQVERVVFVTADLKFYIFNSGEAGRIAGPESMVCEYLGKQGIRPVDIALITHNHFSPERFTPRDNKTFHYFKNRGFRGLFAIYYPATGKVRVKENE